MFDQNQSKIETDRHHTPEIETDFGLSFYSEIWKSRRFIAFSLIAGLTSGGIAGYLMPEKYISKIEIMAGTIEKYDALFSAFIEKTNTDSSANGLIRPELKILESAVSDAVMNPDLVANSISGIKKNELGSLDDINEIYQVRKLTPVRGLERYYTPGFSIDLISPDRNEVLLLTDEYIKELNKHVNDSVRREYKEILDMKLLINDLDFGIAKSKYELDSKNSIDSIQKSIDLANVGGFSKPILSTQMAVTAQIPLATAVPEYFFGYEILEEEKKQIIVDSNDETKIPNYSKFISERNRLTALSNLLAQAKLELVEVKTFPELEVKNGVITKIAAAIVVALLFVLAAFTILAFRVIKRKFDVYPDHENRSTF